MDSGIYQIAGEEKQILYVEPVVGKQCAVYVAIGGMSCGVGGELLFPYTSGNIICGAVL